MPSPPPTDSWLQGVVGSLPWYSLAYLTFYFQLAGMSDSQASLLMALFLGFNAVGAPRSLGTRPSQPRRRWLAALPACLPAPPTHTLPVGMRWPGARSTCSCVGSLMPLPQP